MIRFMLSHLCMGVLGMCLGQSETTSKINVFLDCTSCDNAYFISESPYINYVRDPAAADIHAFIRSAYSSSGQAYTFELIALERFEQLHDTTQLFLSNTLTRAERRDRLFQHFQWRMVPYLLMLGQNETLQITIADLEKHEESDVDPEEDPWRSWIFEVYALGIIDQESNRSDYDLRTGVETDHITEDWRVRVRFRSNYEYIEVQKDESRVSNSNQSQSLSATAVRSLGDHWSAGIATSYSKSTYDNMQFSFYGGPELEYSFFPYQEALKKEVTLAYRIGYNKQNYFETTIFNLVEEDLFRHSITLNARIRQPWGSLFSYIRMAQLLNDLDKNRLSAYMRLNIRLIKGLSVSCSANYQRIRDQISLPRGSASIEDLLLQTRRLATNYDVSLSLGLNYTFGSVYNTVINTRL